MRIQAHCGKNTARRGLKKMLYVVKAGDTVELGNQASQCSYFGKPRATKLAIELYTSYNPR